MAPEVMMETETNEKRDVYRFGIILWELLTRKIPYAEYHQYKDFKHAVSVLGVRPEIPEGTLPSLTDLIKQCWNADYKVRPSFSEIIFRINEVLVDCVIENNHAKAFWTKNFLLKQGDELVESCTWVKFKQTVINELKLTPSDDIYMRTLKRYVSVKKDGDHEVTSASGACVNMESFNMAITWFGEFIVKEYGKKILENIYDIVSQPYFHGHISKEDTLSLLQSQPEGTYLVRLSATTPGKPFTLSITSRTAIDHRRIGQKHPGKPDQMYNLRISHQNYTAPTLPQLIEQCKLILQLLKPCPLFNTESSQYLS